MNNLPCEATSEKSNAAQRILIVDDEPAILFAYCKMMLREGIKVDLCENLENALSSIKSTPYMAVIADVRLSGTDNLDGLELVRSVREFQPGAMVIVATGCDSHEVRRTACEMGVSHYFEKPVRPSDILVVLKNLLNSINPNAVASVV